MLLLFYTITIIIFLDKLIIKLLIYLNYFFRTIF